MLRESTNFLAFCLLIKYLNQEAIFSGRKIRGPNVEEGGPDAGLTKWESRWGSKWGLEGGQKGVQKGSSRGVQMEGSTFCTDPSQTHFCP